MQDWEELSPNKITRQKRVKAVRGDGGHGGREMDGGHECRETGTQGSQHERVPMGNHTKQ